MPQDSPKGQNWPPPLAGRLAPDADAEQIAGAVSALWLEIDQALHPIIGHRGVAALVQRSLNLASRQHPWLHKAAPEAGTPFNPSALHSVLLQEPPAEAAAGAATLFESFHGLLVSLIGPSLTTRLLKAVWLPPPPKSPAAPAQDHAP